MNLFNDINVGIDRYLGMSGNYIISQSLSGDNIPQSEVLVYDSIKQLYYGNYIYGSNGNISNASTSSLGLDGVIRGEQYQTSFDNYEQTTLDPNKYFPIPNGETPVRIGVISIPSKLFGDKIQPNSINIFNPVFGYSIYDDGEGRIFTYNTTNQKRYIGNVVYSHGLIILTKESYPEDATISSRMFIDDFISNEHISLKFNSSYTLYETQYKITISPDEFNYTQNPTILLKPSPTPSPSPSSPAASLYPSRTPSKTPSITPSISISSTPGISLSVTPSISVSATPSRTPSKTPSVTPSISISPSITPSITPTRTVTPTITPSISISPLPGASVINVSFSTISSEVCNNIPTDYYIPYGTTFYNATGIFTDPNLNYPAPIGYYSNGIDKRYWNQSTFFSSTSCLLPLTAYCYENLWSCDDGVHVPPGGSITVWDEYDVPYLTEGYCWDGITANLVTVYSSRTPQTTGMGPITCP